MRCYVIVVLIYTSVGSYWCEQLLSYPHREQHTKLYLQQLFALVRREDSQCLVDCLNNIMICGFRSSDYDLRVTLSDAGMMR